MQAFIYLKKSNKGGRTVEEYEAHEEGRRVNRTHVLNIPMVDSTSVVCIKILAFLSRSISTVKEKKMEEKSGVN